MNDRNEYAPKGARPYHVIGELLYAGVNMRPQRVAVVVQAYTADDAIVQAGLLFRLPQWLIARGYPNGPIERMHVCQLHPYDGHHCSTACQAEGQF